MALPVSLWPPAGLRLHCEGVELRWPDEADLVALAELAELGVHDAGWMPFDNAWTDVPPEERARSVLRWTWQHWAAWTAESWRLPFVVVADGVVVGMQEAFAERFAVTREAETGSWLGVAHQGRGIGTRMRAAVLHLLFDGLGAQHALSAAFADNAASMGVSRRLGYVEDGWVTRARRLPAEGRDVPARMQRLRLSREAWLAAPRPPVEIHGLQRCLPWFGLDG